MNSSSEVLNERQVEEIYGFTIPYLRRARRERRGPRFLKLGKLVDAPSRISQAARVFLISEAARVPTSSSPNGL